jgi:hypothetical protein
MVGRLVDVGGLVVRVVAPDEPGAGPSIVLSDGSGAATARLPVTASAVADALAPGALVDVIGSVEPRGDGRVVVVVDDPANVFVAGQVADGEAGQAAEVAADGSGPAAPVPTSGTDAMDRDRAATSEDTTPIAPLMSAAGAGLLLTGMLAVGAGWRRRLARRRASREATKRLVELLSAGQEPPVHP